MDLVFLFSYDPETKVHDIQIEGEEITTWGFKVIDGEEYWRLENALVTGKRLCLYGKPEIGKLLLINFEDCGHWVMDSLVDILDYIEEERKDI